MRRNFEISSYAEGTYYVLFFENMTLSEVAALAEGNEISDLIGDNFSLVNSHCDNVSQFQKQMNDFREDADDEIMLVSLRYVSDDLETTILK